MAKSMSVFWVLFRCILEIQHFDFSVCLVERKHGGRQKMSCPAFVKGGVFSHPGLCNVYIIQVLG